MEIPFTINGQIIRKTNEFCLANDTQNYLSLSFTFDNTWAEYTKYVIFTYKGKHYQTALEYDSTAEAYVQIVPKEVLKGKGFYFMIFGVVGTERVTTNQVKIDLLESGYTEDISSIDYPDVPDVITRLNEVLDGKVDKETGKGLFTGSYDDLTDKPDIPEKTSDLVNDSGFIDSEDLEDYVQKSSTTGLLKNDGTVDTTSYSTFDGDYDNLTNKPTIPTIPTNVSAFTNDAGYLTEHQSLSNYIQKSSTEGLVKNDGTVDTTSYSTFDGNYNNLSNKPTIPTKTSDLQNDGDGTNVFVKNNDSRLSDSRNPNSHTHGYITNEGKLDDSTGYTGGMPLILDNENRIRKGYPRVTYVVDSNAHSNIGSGSGDSQGAINTAIDTALGNKSDVGHKHQNLNDIVKSYDIANQPYYLMGGTTYNDYLYLYPMATVLSGKQDTLVSGTSIKTINNESILGSGNITVGGSGVDVVTSWEQTLSDSKVASEKLVKNTIDGLSIPTKTSDLTNDGDGTNAFLTQHQSLSNYVQMSSTTGLLKNDGTVMASGTGSTNYAAGNHTHSSYVSATKVTSWSSTVSDSNVPSEKLVKEYIDNQIGTAIQYIQQ